MFMRTVPLEPARIGDLVELWKYLVVGGDGGCALLRPAGGEVGWLAGDEAVAWLEGALRRVVEAARRPASFYDAVSHHTAQLLLDRERVASRLSRLDEALAAQLPELPFWIGLSLDWARTSERVFLVPQVRVSNFRPVSERYAPPAAAVALPEARTVEAAAELLSRDLLQVAVQMYRLRALAEGSPALSVAGREIRPPVFFFAEAEGSRGRAEDWVGFAGEARGLETLARATLGTEALRSEGTMGALAAGSLLTVRRERVDTASVQVAYLMLPCGSPERQGPAPEENEREAIFLADRLAYVELSLAGAAARTARELEAPALWMRLWDGSLDSATQLSRELERRTVFEATGAPRKLHAFRMVGRLRMLISRLEPEMVRVTDRVMAVEERWRLETEQWRAHATQHLGTAPVAGLAPLELGRTEFAARETTRVALSVLERGRRLRETFQAIGRALREMLAQEEREHRELEERRREAQRRRDERRERILGYALASLAAVTAFPILIGEMDWGQIREVMSSWPAGFVWMRTGLQAAHPYLALTAIVAAAGVIAFVISMIVWNLLVPRGQDRSSFGEEADAAAMQAYGRHLKSMWGCVARGEELLGSGRERARVLSEIERLDQQACEHAVALWELLREERDRAGGRTAPGSDGMAALGTRVRVFLFLCELLDNRPERIPLPGLLCVFRCRSTDFVRSSVVSDEEFRTTLSDVDLDAGALERELETRGLRTPGVALPEFVAGAQQAIASLRGAAH